MPENETTPQTEPTTPAPTIKDIDSSLVTVGQPVEGGCCYVNFAANPTLPDSATVQIDKTKGWESVGDLSDNGYSESKETSSTDFKSWRGSIVLSSISESKNKYKLEFIEVSRGAVAKLRYGSNAVTVGADGTVERIKGIAPKSEPVALVIDELESNGYLRRTVIPKATIDSFDDVPHQKGSLMVYGMTFTASEVDGRSFDIFRAKPSEA